ncbi:DMSO/TMAO reductase YedYZ heme-binding membrane subunit [Streptomyces glaucescens]
MTWALTTVISLLLRAAGPLIRRGLPRLALAAMATLACGTVLAAGHGLLHLARCLPDEGGLLATLLVGLLGAAVRLAATVGLVAVVFLTPLAIAADFLNRRPPNAGDGHSTTTP